MRKPSLLIIAIMFLLTIVAQAQRVGSTVRHLGVAPLLGPCYSREKLMQLSVQYQQVLRVAVRQAGHSQQVADQVVQMLCLGQATAIRLPDGAQLATMAWYGVDVSGRSGVHTLWNPRLALGADVPCWEVRVTIESKTIVFVLPMKCGNLARLGVEHRVTIQTELPPPIVMIPPPPPPEFAFAPAAKRSTLDQGDETNLGSTQSSGEIRFYPKPGDTNVSVNGVSSAASSSSSSASSASSSQNTNVNNNNNNNNNQNNNSAISQAQNVVPVNVVVNTGDGDASGTATGSGEQDANVDQGNNP